MELVVHWRKYKHGNRNSTLKGTVPAGTTNAVQGLAILRTGIHESRIIFWV